MTLGNLIVKELAFYFIDFGQDESTLEINFFFKKIKLFYITYLINILAPATKTLLLSMILSIGGFFNNVKLSFKKYWLTSILGDFVFILSSIVEIIWFYFKDGYSSNEVQAFYPLSVLNFFNYEQLDLWAIFLLQQLNLFQLLNWVVIIFLLNKELNKKMEPKVGLKIVYSSYVPSWILWILFTTLINLTKL